MNRSMHNPGNELARTIDAVRADITRHEHERARAKGAMMLAELKVSGPLIAAAKARLYDVDTLLRQRRALLKRLLETKQRRGAAASRYAKRTRRVRSRIEGARKQAELQPALDAIAPDDTALLAAVLDEEMFENDNNI
jgi:hypothetical protein